MKKLALVFLSLMMLIGCGSQTADNEETPELIFYNIGTPTKDNDMVNDAINEYLEEINAGFTLDITYIDWGDYEQKMEVINNSGEYYDLAFTAAWAGPYLAVANKGAFMDIEDILIEHAPETIKQIGGKETLDVVRVNDKVYAVPSALKAINLQIMFDKELVEKYDVPYQEINSLEKLKPWFEKIAANEPDYDMLQIGEDFSIPHTYDEIIWPIGVQFEDESLEVVNMFETDELKSQLDLMHEFYTKKYVNQDAAIVKEVKDKKFFTNIADGGPSAAAIWSTMYKQDLVTTSIIDEPYATTAATHGSMMAVSSGSKHPEKAVQFIELMNTDEKLQNMLSYGIEGHHYEFDEHGRVVETENFKDYDGVPYFTLGTGKVRALQEADQLDIKELEEEYANSLQKSALLGFSFDATEVQSEIANIQNVRDEFKSSLVTGSVDPKEYVAKMNEKLEAAGIDKVIEEITKQIEDWKE